MKSYTKENRLLTIDKLHLQYGEKVILRDITLAVDNIVRPGMHQGQVIALLGPSGMGKTQLFRCIAGLQQPTSGSVLLYGDKKAVAGDVGVVFQSYPLFKNRTVLSNLKLANRGKPDEQIIKHLERFGLTDKQGLYPAQLSGGQRQRVAIIQQLLCSEHFLLMDEPFSGLDIKMKDEVIKVIHEVAITHEHNTMIVTTHDIESAVRIADTIWVLGNQKSEDGKILPGAVCTHHIDLIERGLAWETDIENHPHFDTTVKEIKNIFH